MDNIKTRGIITRCADYGESNRMLTVLTGDMGVISVCAYGVRSSKSKMKASTEVLCLCDFVLGRKSGEIYRMETSEVVESFYPIREDFEKLSLANYLAELSRDAMADGDVSVLSLLLNTLYVMAYRDTDINLVKAVFELRLAAISGYAPYLLECMVCGGEGDLFSFEGGIVCRMCKKGECVPISIGTVQAMKYILATEEKKLFSFSVTDEIKNQLFEICEKYLITKTEKKYKSLEYYNKIRRK